MSTIMKKYIVILGVAALSLTACKDFLVEEPVMTQSTELTLSDFNGLNKSVAGAYSPLAAQSWYGAEFVLNSEMRAGNAMLPDNPDFRSGRMTVPYNMSYDPSSTEGIWSYAYFIISACNNVLDAIEKKGESLLTGDLEQQDLDNLKAEALALRGFCHFDLLRTFARTDGKSAKELGVPVILVPQLPSDMPKRATVEETYAAIISDLTTAENLMDPAYQRAGVTDSKATINADVIKAMLARVYLYKKEYQKAADYATAIIKSGRYQLWSAEEYCSVWGEDVPKGGEVIFEVYGKNANDYDAYWEGPSHMTNPVGYADCAASAQLADLFAEGDVRGLRGVRTVDDGNVMFCTDPNESTNGQLWTMKYYGKGEGDATSIPDVSNTILFRLSEMYLIRAEALARGASVAGASALADVNAIREARGASKISAAGPDAIMLERRLELNFEGHYWFDLARTGGSVSYKDAKMERNIPADSKYWAMPIPKSQIDVDPELEQNPGYNE